MGTIGFIGAGNMAQSMINGILSARLCQAGDIVASDVREERLSYLAGRYGVRTAISNTVPASEADMVVLSVKPQNFRQVLDEIRGKIKKDSVVISIAAGIKIDTITRSLGDIAVIRAMPNTPAMIQQGATALVARNTSPQQLKAGLDIFAAIGKAVLLENEDLIDAVTAVSGSGPAYFFLLIEEMIKSAAKLGLPGDIANTLVLQTAKGAILLAEAANAQNRTAEQLRQDVASPGGTTEAAIKTFKDRGLPEILLAGITAARDRSRQLSSRSL